MSELQQQGADTVESDPVELTGTALIEAINKARRRVLDGEQLSTEEQTELVKLLRQNRFAASEASTKTKSKSTAKKGLTDAQLDDSLDKALGL